MKGYQVLNGLRQKMKLWNTCRILAENLALSLVSAHQTFNEKLYYAPSGCCPLPDLNFCEDSRLVS